MKRIFLLLLIFSSVYQFSFSQTINGQVIDESNHTVSNISVRVLGKNLATNSDSLGRFSISLPDFGAYKIEIRGVGYEVKQYDVKLSAAENTYFLKAKLNSIVLTTNEVDVVAKKEDEISTTYINPKLAKFIPSPFNDFNKVLTTLTGVVSNSELSSTYSVRGGSYDENLVYVNDMEVYRPFLVKAGQQEGLSFVNQDLVSNVEFSSGGWKAKYGDKLSSVLNISYKKPKKYEGSASGSLLGATLHLGGISKNERINYVFGYRNKNGTYLLNTLPVNGQYFPKFYDIQSFINIDISKNYKVKPGTTTLGILFSYAQNRYSVIPQTQQTSFGTASQMLLLTVGFDGKEIMQYDTYQGAVKLSHKFTKMRSDVIFSAVNSFEREYVDLEMGYRLCDLIPNSNGSAANKCATTRGLGTTYNYDRNALEVNIQSVENKNTYLWTSAHTTEFGAKVSHENLKDRYNEYSFSDSSDFVNLNYSVNQNSTINSIRSSAFVQHNWQIADSTKLTFGLRLAHWSVNNQLLASPRVQFSHQPKWKKNYSFHAAWGIYQQAPFYREMRNFAGNLNLKLKAQSSMHFIVGAVRNFKGWGRNFKFTSEAFYKPMWNIVPYDVDNVRLRYYGENSAKAYAVGADFRVSGEFLKGEESWFSLGLLQTKENVNNDNRGYIRRPTDQFMTFGVFFQDHLPNKPTVKMFLNGIYGSGLPTGVPNDERNRQAFKMPSYKRVDIGFSKLISFENQSKLGKFFSSIWISAEVLNLIGASNTISYLWITDVEKRKYAVPNSLSQRFLNLRIIAKL